MIRGSLVAAVALFALALPGAALAKPALLAPNAGEKLESAPAKVKLRAPWKLRSLRVWLNGQSISREFGRADIGSRNRRTVRVSAGHGLRYGENVLRVKKQRYGARPKTEKVRFRLGRELPLVGAGRDRTVHVGRPISLNAGSSRGRGSARGAAGLETNWELVRKPAGSSAELDGVTTARPRLEPDLPGTYVSQLVVTDQGVDSVADTVETTALMPTPLVPVDTAATVGGEQGIAIGYHPAEEGGRAPQGSNEEFFALGSGDALQLVVLDRETLETVTSWSGPPTSAGIAELQTKLGDLGDDDLVIVTAWAASWSPLATLELVDTPDFALGQIGAALQSGAQIDAYGLEHGGQHSWIGVPGFSPGDAWEIGAQGDVGLRGFLAPDNNDNYAYMATDPTTYDLGPDGQAVSISLGDAPPYTGSLPTGEGGFLVAYVNGLTLEPADLPNVPSGGKVYVTRNSDGTPNYDGMFGMVDDLDVAAGQGTPLVIAIRSIGPAPVAQIDEQPPDYEGTLDYEYLGALYVFTDAFANVGGHEQAIYGMATQPTGQDSYSLLGSNYAVSGGTADPQGSGTDVGSQVGPQPRTHLAGALARDKDSRYIAKVTTDQAIDPALAQVTLAEPVDWPSSDSAGEQAALSCIGNAQGLGPDPRVAYWMQTYDDDRWFEVKTAIADMQPSACPGVDATDFTTVRDELATEIGWLLNVRSYLGALTSPFSNSGLSSYADLQTITDEVVDAVNPPPAQPAGIDGLEVFADIADLVAEAEVPLASQIGATFFLVDDLTSQSDDGPTVNWGERVESESADVGQELAQQLETIADSNEELADIIVADYEKLKTVGTLGQCTPGESGCTPQWQITQDQQSAVSRSYEISAKRQIWGGILPAAYPYVLYTNSDPGSYGGTFEGPQEEISGIGCDFYPPFTDADENPLAEPTFLRYGVRVVADTTFMVFSQENFRGSKDSEKARATRYPSASLVSPLFAELDPGGDPDKGGLALDQYSFMIDNWQVPFPTAGATTREDWDGC